MHSCESVRNEWLSVAEIDAMPLDILSQWFWQPLTADTAAKQSLVRRAAERLWQPPAVPPVYRFIEPAKTLKKESEKTVKKAANMSEQEMQPEQSSLDIFKSLFRTP